MSGMQNTQQRININKDYQYDSEDMKDILQKSIDARASKDALKINVTCFEDKAGSIDSLLKQFSAKLDKDKTPNRIELLSCFMNEHWIGVIFRFDQLGEIEHAEYYDSFSPVDEATSKKIKDNLCNVPFKKVNCLLQDDQNKVNSGPYLIENLKLAVFLQLSSSAESVLKPVDVRVKHLSLCEGSDFEKFHAKQNRGMNTSNTTTESIALQSLLDLNDALLGLVPDREELIAKYEEDHALMSLFESVCDKELRLKLKYNKIADNKDLTPFLHRNQNNDAGARNYVARHRQAGFTLGYVGARFFGLVAPAAEYMGIAGPAFMLVEPLIAPVAAIGLGFTYGGRCVTENMATDITRALEFANKSELDEDSETIKDQAEGILKHQFGIERSFIGDLPYRVLRGVRYCSTPQDQYAFAHLLRAQFAADRKDEAAFAYLHNDVFMNTKNDDYKVMSIIAMLTILHDMSAWNEPFSPVLQNKLIAALVSKLHSINSKLVDLYILYVLRKFMNFMQDEIRKLELSKLSKNDLTVLQEKINLVAELNSLHCLRYSRVFDNEYATGKLIEVACMRMQVLLHCLMADLCVKHGMKREAAKQVDLAKEKDERTKYMLPYGKSLKEKLPEKLSSLPGLLKKDLSEHFSKITASISSPDADQEAAKIAPVIDANVDTNSKLVPKNDMNEVKIELPEKVKCLLYYFEQAGQGKPTVLPSPPSKPNESVEGSQRTCQSFRNVT